MSKVPPLPRQLNSDDPKEISAVVRQIVDYLRNIPKFEIKQSETASTTNTTLLTSLPTKLKGVQLLQAFKTDFPDDTLASATMNPDWRNTADGAKVRLDLSEVKHTMIYLLVGD